MLLDGVQFDKKKEKRIIIIKYVEKVDIGFLNGKFG